MRNRLCEIVRRRRRRSGMSGISTRRGRLPAAYAAMTVPMPARGASPTASTQGSTQHPWNSLQAVTANEIGNTPIAGYAFPLLSTASYDHYVTGVGYRVVPGPSGPIEPGDEILLMSGNYGDVRICQSATELSNSSFVTVAAAPGQTPVLTSLAVCSTSMWAFDGLKVQSLEAAAGGSSSLVAVTDQGGSFPTSNIVFENMTSRPRTMSAAGLRPNGSRTGATGFRPRAAPEASIRNAFQ